MENPITLDSLIQRGDVIHNGITKAPRSPNVRAGPFYLIDDLRQYERWNKEVIRFLRKYYGGDISIQHFEDAIVEFEKLHNSPDVFTKMLGILESCKNIPGVIEHNIAQQKIGTQINLHQNQSQQQSQSIQIFIEAIKDELTGKQQRELKAIIDDDIEPESKRSKILHKLKSFGIDTLSNIVANIATNPNIWG